MKKLLLILLVFITAKADAQVFQKPVGYGFEYRRLITDTLFAFPSDTFPIATNLKSYLWAARKGDSIYLWSPVQDKWVLNSGGSSGGSGTVTAISQGYGIINSTNPITTTGTQRIDTSSGGLQSYLRGVKIADSLGAIIATKGSGTVTSVTGTANRITITGTATVNPTVDIAATYVGQTSITTLGTIATGVWNGTAIANANLANSTISGISLGSNLTDLTRGYGIIYNSGTTYNGGTARTVLLDSATVFPQIRATISSSGGSDSLFNDTTFHKVSSYTADQKRGNVLGTLFDESSFANLDDFTVGAGSTPTVSGGKITDTVGSASCLTCYVGLDPTMLERWTITAGFTVDDKTGTSYGVQIGTYSINSVYLQNIRGFINLRSSGIYQGRLDLVDGQYLDNTLVSSTSNISFSVGDSIEITLQRNINIFTFIARNVTTGAAEVSVSYTYTGSTTAANTGIPLFAWRGGKQSLYSFKFSSDESIETQLLLRGDSKMTWYGNNVTQRIPNMIYQMFGNAVSQSGSGDMTAQAVSTLDETILLSPEKALFTVGSNDIRNGISAGTWQANIDTIWNKLTRNGIEVFFSLMYETDVDQSALITYLLLNYPDNTILDGYYATQECNSCLLSDDIHLTAYGNKKWLEATAESGVIDFFNHFREMKFTAGDALYTAVGDSLAINRYFATSNKVNVFREGVLQWPLEEGEAGDGYRRRGDTIIFIPDLASDEKIIIQTYNRIQWVAIEPQAAPFDFLLADFPNAERAYSVGRKLSPLYSGSAIKVRRDNDDAESNIGYVNNVLDTATLKTFVGANSAYIVTLYDNSGNGEDATQSSSSLQPRIMNAGVIDRVQNDDGDWVPAMYFDGSNDYLGYTNVTSEAVNWSLMYVSKRSALSVGGALIAATGGNTATIFQGGDNNFYFMRTYSVAGLAYKTGSGAVADFCLIEGFASSNVGYHNGSSISFGSESFGASGSTSFNTIGRLATGYTSGHISEVVLYNTDQLSNRAGIETNINNFWKLY